jgi:hypothetical protein
MATLSRSVEVDSVFVGWSEQEKRWNWPETASVVAGLVVIALLAVWIAVDDDAYLRPLDDANLAFHEAGHMFYGILGSTLGLYGGTLGQLTFPAIAAVSFFRRREPVSCAVAVAWFGQNWFNIAHYAADAQAQELPLVGGGEHDWFNILSRWSVLHHDQTVAQVMRVGGWALVLGSLASLGWGAWRAKRPLHE